MMAVTDVAADDVVKAMWISSLRPTPPQWGTEGHRPLSSQYAGPGEPKESELPQVVASSHRVAQLLRS